MVSHLRVLRMHVVTFSAYVPPLKRLAQRRAHGAIEVHSVRHLGRALHEEGGEGTRSVSVRDGGVDEVSEA